MALLQTLKQKLGPSYSLSVALGVGDYNTRVSYDIPKIFAACDFVNLMSHDLHGGWEPNTGHHTGLFSNKSLDPTNLNVDYSVKLLLNKGVSKDKLVIGIATYGRSFILASASSNGIGATAGGDANLKHEKICPRIIDSIREQTNRIRFINFDGAVVWNLDTDFYDNLCSFYGWKTFIEIVADDLNLKQSGNTAPAVANATVINAPIIQAPSGGSFICPGNGLFKHPTDCSKYYNCGNGVAYEMSCGAPLLFNPNTKNCDWSYNFSC